MFYRILVATDGSQLTRKAAEAAIDLAQNYPGSNIVGMSITDHMLLARTDLAAGTDMMDHELHKHELAQRLMDQIAEMAKAAGVPFETFVEHSPRVPENILQALSKHKCNCIFMTWKDNGEINEPFSQDIHSKVLADANVPVVIYR